MQALPLAVGDPEAAVARDLAALQQVQRGVDLALGAQELPLFDLAVRGVLPQLAPDLRAVGGWRGPLAMQRSEPAYNLAARVIETAMDLATT